MMICIDMQIHSYDEIDAAIEKVKAIHKKYGYGASLFVHVMPKASRRKSVLEKVAKKKPSNEEGGEEFTTSDLLAASVEGLRYPGTLADYLREECSVESPEKLLEKQR